METEISKKFAEIDTSDFPDFYDYKKPLKRSLNPSIKQEIKFTHIKKAKKFILRL
jgi:hypothetical protein